MASSVEALSTNEQGAARPCLCENYARVTERSALASARWLGRADEQGATEAACAGMQESLE
jgi:fructose-1,6-bisphosphatase/sedoheptulose 1,7-bisphosphatase-like protein